MVSEERKGLNEEPTRFLLWAFKLKVTNPNEPKVKERSNYSDDEA